MQYGWFYCPECFSGVSGYFAKGACQCLSRPAWVAGRFRLGVRHSRFLQVACALIRNRVRMIANVLIYLLVGFRAEIVVCLQQLWDGYCQGGGLSSRIWRVCRCLGARPGSSRQAAACRCGRCGPPPRHSPPARRLCLPGRFLLLTAQDAAPGPPTGHRRRPRPRRRQCALAFYGCRPPCSRGRDRGRSLPARDDRDFFRLGFLVQFLHELAEGRGRRAVDGFECDGCVRSRPRTGRRCRPPGTEPPIAIDATRSQNELDASSARLRAPRPTLHHVPAPKDRSGL